MSLKGEQKKKVPPSPSLFFFFGIHFFAFFHGNTSKEVFFSSRVKKIAPANKERKISQIKQKRLISKFGLALNSCRAERDLSVQYQLLYFVSLFSRPSRVEEEVTKVFPQLFFTPSLFGILFSPSFDSIYIYFLSIIIWAGVIRSKYKRVPPEVPMKVFSA